MHLVGCLLAQNSGDINQLLYWLGIVKLMFIFACQFMLVLNIITSFNLLTFFCLLFFRKDNVLPNKILALTLLVPVINFLSNINILTGGLANHPYIYFCAQFTGFIFGPLVYSYILLMTGKKIKLLHPAFIATALCILFGIYLSLEFYNMPTQGQEAYLDGVINEPYPQGMMVINGIFIIMQQVYFTLAAIQVIRFRKDIQNAFSNYEQTKVKFITIFIALIWLLNLITIGLYIALPATEVEYIYLPLVLTIIYCFILYFSFHYNSIFTSVSYKIFQEDSVNVEILSDTEVGDGFQDTPDYLGLQAVLDSIEESFAQNELYTNPDLTISSLSSSLKIPVKKISLSINKLLNKKFYDYINDKRIEKSIILLEHRSHYTIEAVAKESGFNSRSAFYRAFKKNTGKTPIDYMEDKRSVLEN